MNWTQMQPAQFDQTQLATKRAREVVQTAAATLFPDMLPDMLPESKPAAAVITDPLGTVPMFGTEEL